MSSIGWGYGTGNCYGGGHGYGDGSGGGYGDGAGDGYGDGGSGGRFVCVTNDNPNEGGSNAEN